MIYYKTILTPVGKMTIVSDGTSITKICFGTLEKTHLSEYGESIMCVDDIKPDSKDICSCVLHAHTMADEAEKQLKEYFAGKRKNFDLPLNPAGTLFQRCVWDNLKKIPYGETASYSKIARMSGNEKAYRAAGGACNKNPIAIIIPCHRCVGANGGMVGYAGGLDVKKFLLKLETSN